MRLIVFIGIVTVAGITPAAAQLPDLGGLIPTGAPSASGRIVQLLALLTVLSVAPGLLIMVTCFTRFIIALSFLRIGIGLQTTPGNLVLVSLALFLTFYVMGPTFDESWQTGVKPLIEEKITEAEAFERIAAPFKKFMTHHVREKDVRLFEELAGVNPADRVGNEPELRVLLPAFMISELRRGFEIGFLIVLPFLVIDLIVATLTMSMGMMMLPPTAISLPFKVLFFVLLDGWYLLVGSLVRSYS
ncbi:MAG: flagellar type III secretion system pore protein FliP [Alphaproteobacteria bacterium]|nr:flagellar type III secretion system pore protein FliP [Alphaproteobacteria bacterium]